MRNVFCFAIHVSRNARKTEALARNRDVHLTRRDFDEIVASFYSRAEAI